MGNDGVRAPKGSQKAKKQKKETRTLRYIPAVILGGAALLVVICLLVAGLFAAGLFVLINRDGKEDLPEPGPAVKCTVNEDLAGMAWTISSEPPFFVEGQVIITGLATQVDRVAEEFELEPIETCQLNYLSAIPGGSKQHQQPFSFSTAKPGELTTNLYYVRDRSVQDVIDAVRGTGEGWIVTDRNRLTGLPLSACGNPRHPPVGSPFETAELLPVGEAEAAKLFWEQWAFRQVGVGPALKNSLGGAIIEHQGQGTLVGVFDTSPFVDPWQEAPDWERALVIDRQESVKWLHPTMDVLPLILDVSYPRWISKGAAQGTMFPNGEKPDDDIRDHGLFVASLVHAVAPQSEIRLIRVLDEYGCGDLFTLDAALHSFVGEMKAEARNSKGVVINLSLGVPDLSYAPDTTLEECAKGTLETDGASICHALFDAREAGMVIVAAAGNESAGEDEPLPAMFPAVFSDRIISVQATGGKSQLACFSNEGAVSASGGGENPSDDSECVSKIHDCKGDCAEGVIGLVLFPPEGTDYWPTHYAYWSGTSFAAPLVSGEAALLLQAGVAPDQVSEEIADNTCSWPSFTVPEGIINLPRALLGVPCPDSLALPVP